MSYTTINSDINEFLQSNPGDIYINALSESMPFCNILGKSATVNDIKTGDVCNVYCAQPSCDAAKKYLKSHDFSKCSRVNYLKQGALHINKSLLQNGDECHNAIHEWNASRKSN